MVLAATIGIAELAALLGVETADAEQLLAAAELPVWSLDAGHRRVGWRSARTLLLEQEGDDEERLRAALRWLQDLRAGAARLRTGAAQLMLEPVRRELAPPIDGYQDEQLLELVSRAARDLGGRVTRARFTAWAMPFGVTAQELSVRFCRPWSDVLLLSGGHEQQSAAAEPGLASDRKRLLALLRDAAAAVGGGERLSGRAFDLWAAREGQAVTAAGIIGVFGTWNTAKQEACLPVRPWRQRVRDTDDELLERMREAAADLYDPSLSALQFDDWCQKRGLPVRSHLVISRHGSWNQAKRRAGLVVRPRGFRGHTGPADR